MASAGASAAGAAVSTGASSLGASVVAAASVRRRLLASVTRNSDSSTMHVTLRKPPREDPLVRIQHETKEGFGLDLRAGAAGASAG